MSQGYYNGNYNNGNYNNGYYNGNYNGQYYNPNYRYNRNYQGTNFRNNRGGANNPNYRNNNANNSNNNNDNKGHKKKGNNTPLYIIIACLLLVVAGVTGLLFVPIGGTSDIKRGEGEEEKPETSNKEDIKIGDETYGYITVPYDYVKYNGNKSSNTIKYASKDRKYYVTMAYKAGTNAYTLGRASLEAIKKAGATEAKLAQVTIEEREAYQLYAVTDTDTTVLALVIDDDNGVTHFITIEGPDGTNKIFGALETYTFE